MPVRHGPPVADGRTARSPPGRAEGHRAVADRPHRVGAVLRPGEDGRRTGGTYQAHGRPVMGGVGGSASSRGGGTFDSAPRSAPGVSWEDGLPSEEALTMSGIEAARTVKRRLRTELARVPAVCGLGLARRDHGWVVLVLVRSERERPDVPDAIDGVPVQVRVVGDVHAQRGDATTRACTTSRGARRAAVARSHDPSERNRR